MLANSVFAVEDGLSVSDSSSMKREGRCGFVGDVELEEDILI
jgi:hypothetical protein